MDYFVNRFITVTDARYKQSVLRKQLCSSLSNMIVEGVIKTALKMIRAARFCNLERRSIFAAVVLPQVLQPCNQVAAVYNFDRISFEYSGVRISRCV